MADTEHRDVYIAAAVGGVGFVLLMLYLYSGNSVPNAGALVADPASPTGVTVIPPSLPTPYTYNVPPYNPNPPIMFGANNTPANSNSCCDTCGPTSGGQYFDTTVGQFMTLIGRGGEAGAA